MADLPSASANTMLNALVSTSTTYKLSLHTGDPGTTGANEVSGGSYARQSIQFTGGASGGVVTSTDAQTFSSMPAVTISYFGVWTSGGTYEWGGSLGGSTVVPSGQTVNFAIGGITGAAA